MDFVRTGGAAASLGLGSENGPILYIEPNRTSAIEDIRSVIIYIIIVAIFVGFFSILPGIRHERFPTFMCITVSLIVSSANIIAMFGTTWHVGEAPISAAYKAFSRDRIQGELSVKIGLQSVNITLKAHKYYILHDTQGPIVMENAAPVGMASSIAATSATLRSSAAQASTSALSTATAPTAATTTDNKHELKTGQSEREFEPPPEESELVEVEEEAFAGPSVNGTLATGARRSPRSSESERKAKTIAEATKPRANATGGNGSGSLARSASQPTTETATSPQTVQEPQSSQSQPQQQQQQQQQNIKRVNVDINFNERFYWIEPDQMRHEHHSALERGLPYPILTVVEYLSQDDGGFSWSRKYRMAGYYASIMLWVSSSLCVLMFFLHCAAPKYGIYMMQIIGCIHLATNFTYATLVPSGYQKLVIPFEGQSLTFDFGLNFWLVLFSGCLALVVGSLIVIVDFLFPNFIFTTILDVDFDVRNDYHRHRRKQKEDSQALVKPHERLIKPPFANVSLSTATTSINSKASSVEAPVSPTPTTISALSGSKLAFAAETDSSATFVGPETEMDNRNQSDVTLTVTPPPSHSHLDEADSQMQPQLQQKQLQQQLGATRQRLARTKNQQRGDTNFGYEDDDGREAWSSRV